MLCQRPPSIAIQARSKILKVSRSNLAWILPNRKQWRQQRHTADVATIVAALPAKNWPWRPCFQLVSGWFPPINANVFPVSYKAFMHITGNNGYFPCFAKKPVGNLSNKMTNYQLCYQKGQGQRKKLLLKLQFTVDLFKDSYRYGQNTPKLIFENLKGHTLLILKILHNF